MIRVFHIDFITKRKASFTSFDIVKEFSEKVNRTV